MKPTDGSCQPGVGAVVLHEVDADTGVEKGLAVPGFDKVTARVGDSARLDKLHRFDRKIDKFHAATRRDFLDFTLTSAVASVDCRRI